MAVVCRYVESYKILIVEYRYDESYVVNDCQIWLEQTLVRQSSFTTVLGPIIWMASPSAKSVVSISLGGGITMISSLCLIMIVDHNKNNLFIINTTYILQTFCASSSFDVCSFVQRSPMKNILQQKQLYTQRKSDLKYQIYRSNILTWRLSGPGLAYRGIELSLHISRCGMWSCCHYIGTVVRRLDRLGH